MRWPGYGVPCSGSSGEGREGVQALTPSVRPADRTTPGRHRGPGGPGSRGPHRKPGAVPGSLRCGRQVCFDASSITVMSDGAPIRVGGPQAPAPRLTYSWVSP
ncbi:hypothetical protein GCM10027162_71690 [Streptomyces incanus]